ncbi:MAG: phosphatidate cytidylyltransferase [gamma proteobacterium endosymbiont of Lamellibrachia anaximandri]|nr:phosphatidate cytidylyltransferase [gamma proteobacterium endosymbiont of Lamellibrachia anaximandri]MBL3533274.1 phosphatidate cytidylyltransferase [gamma proteobacterium endosymbiont of Lamellibrachia anaximandri]MBL3599276.1 phosphatidate cytidylyltransferase [gamma proteobacterium endosymbiont of Lamellibrachia anaximandri]
MLKQRVLTALILAPLIITGVLWSPTLYLALALALFLAICGFEWARLSGTNGPVGQFGYILVLGLFMAAATMLLEAPTLLLWLFALVVFWWSVVLIRLRHFRSGAVAEGFSLTQSLEGIIVLVPAWLAWVTLHQVPEQGPQLLLFLLILIWAADIGAYFAGRRFGRTKLAPEVSPGKTREGVYGAIAGSLVCGVFFIWWQGFSPVEYPLALLLCVLTVIFSVVGDLFESVLKRLRNVKDSGTLLPGHGGMLDRLDSLTAAAPVFVLGLMLMGKIG